MTRSLCAMIMLWGVPAVCQSRVDVRRAVAPDAFVRLSGAISSLRVIGWAHDSLVITGTIPKGGRLDGGVGGGDGSALPKGAKFYVEQPTELASGAVLEVRVPARVRLWTKVLNARVEVSGLTGGLDVNNVGGEIRISGDLTELNIESMDAPVTVTGSPSWMRVKTAAGHRSPVIFYQYTTKPIC